MNYFSTSSGIALLAHRGLVLPNSGVVENTAPAFESALMAGATHIETDVQVTKDMVPVLFHDETLQRLTGDPRRLESVTFEELQKLAGSRGFDPLPLREALESFPEVRFNLDIKAWKAVDPVATELNDLDAHGRVLVSSFSDKRRLATVALLDNPVATSAGSETVIKARLSAFGPMKKLLQTTLIGIDAVQIPTSMYGVRFATRNFVARLRESDIQVHFWTVNSLAQAEELIELGATGIVSDRVDLLSPLLGNS